MVPPREEESASTNAASSPTSAGQQPQQPDNADNADNADDNMIISRIYLIRHGDGFDYQDPSLWLQMAKKNGALVTDPPLNELGHVQAQETANYLAFLIKKRQRMENNVAATAASPNNGNPHGISKIMALPYLRVIQTACPTANALDIFQCPWKTACRKHTPRGSASCPVLKNERLAAFAKTLTRRISP